MTEDVQHILCDLEFDAGIEISAAVFERLRSNLDSSPLSIQDPLKQIVVTADEFQTQVIEARAEVIRMLAPAGSGKTQTVANRVLRRVSEGVKPERVLVLTFDNSAAGSLRATFQSELAKHNLSSLAVKITTLNAFGYELLRTYFPPEYKGVVTPKRQHGLLRELLSELQKRSEERFKSLPTNLQRRFYREIFSLLKNALFDPRSIDAQKLAEYLMGSAQAQPFFAEARDPAAAKLVVEALIWLYRGYELLLQRERMIDFDDQKLRPYALLTDSPDLLSRVQGAFAEVIVDEFQDINRLDFELVKLLAARAVLVVTGDDDQAIYGFRGCSPEFIINLEAHLGRPVVHYELRRNYRNPANIVEIADRLIRKNTNRIVKSPIATRTERVSIKVVASQSAGIEAKLIASQILRLKASSHISFSDFAVLYRTNAQSLPLQIEFLLAGIPFHVREEDSILHNEILERLIGSLRVKAALDSGREPSPQDAALFVRAYFQYVPAPLTGALERVFLEGQSFLETVASGALGGVLRKAEGSNLAETALEASKAKGLLRTLDVLARFRGLHGMIGSLEDVLEERVPLGEIYSLAGSFRGGIAEFATMLDTAIERARSQVDASAEEGQVALATHFRAKGRQWHTVVLATCNEGLIPHKRAPLEEERRLMYVALTRASANLIVSYVKKMCNLKVEVSRFLAEAEIG
jgi:DNA helicase II / ATP-dependent DNA helicase PcrA